MILSELLLYSSCFPSLSSHSVIGSHSKELDLVWTIANFPFHASAVRCWNFRSRGKFTLILKLWHSPICVPEKVCSVPCFNLEMEGVVQLLLNCEIVISRQWVALFPHFDTVLLSVMRLIFSIRSSARRKLLDYQLEILSWNSGFLTSKAYITYIYQNIPL